MADRESLRDTIAADISRTDMDSRINTAINDAMNEIARRHDFKALMLTHQGTLDTTETAYVLPTRCKDIYSIRLIDGQSSLRLVEVSTRWMDKNVPDSDSATTGKPNRYMRWGNTIYLDKIPDSAYTVQMRFSKWATPLSEDTDEPEFENMDDVIRYFAIVQLYDSKALYGDATHWRAQAERRLALARYADRQSPDWVPKQAEFVEERLAQADDTANPHIGLNE